MEHQKTRQFSLAAMTVLPLAPPQAIATAAKAGYDAVGLRLLPPAPSMAAYPLMDDATMLRETQAQMQGTGVRVFDLEIVRLNAQFDARAFLPFLDVGAKLGARAVLVAGDDSDATRQAQSFAAFCELAAPFGLTANIEFMPWTAVKNCNDAAALVRAAGSPNNAGVLVDAIHFARSASSLADVAALPREWLHYGQLCDAIGVPDSMEEIVRQARGQRLLPGEGDINLQGLVQTLPSDLTISVEAWHEHRAPAAGLDAWAKAALLATKAIS
jgi:sugar phosphate isomerase/epimerase